MSREDRKEQLRLAATQVVGSCSYYGEAYYLRKRLREDHGIHLSPACLRVWMQELAEAGHFQRSKYPHGGQGYTWSLPSKPIQAEGAQL